MTPIMSLAPIVDGDVDVLEWRKLYEMIKICEFCLIFVPPVS